MNTRNINEFMKSMKLKKMFQSMSFIYLGKKGRSLKSFKTSTLNTACLTHIKMYFAKKGKANSAE